MKKTSPQKPCLNRALRQLLHSLLSIIGLWDVSSNSYQPLEVLQKYKVTSITCLLSWVQCESLYSTCCVRFSTAHHQLPTADGQQSLLHYKADGCHIIIQHLPYRSLVFTIITMVFAENRSLVTYCVYIDLHRQHREDLRLILLYWNWLKYTSILTIATLYTHGV